MTNVPLDSSNRRYPNMYPDQLNQLNNQISNLNVTQVGYNKIWVIIFIEICIFIEVYTIIYVIHSLIY